jgi:hypothetical protein
VCTERGKKREKERKNREKTQFLSIFFLKKFNSQKKYKKNKKNALAPG